MASGNAPGRLVTGRSGSENPVIDPLRLHRETTSVRMAETEGLPARCIARLRLNRPRRQTKPGGRLVAIRGNPLKASATNAQLVR